MNKENIYIAKRIIKSKIQSIPFYLCRVFSINKKKIVFCCIEGTTGYTCNPKYIAEELIRQKADYELVWLVNDTSKKFPKEIKVVRNTLWNRAYQLTTARIWIDNSRKQLEARKRKGQVYIQTWHAKLGFKPTCLDRGAAFSKIAYLVSKHDSDMIDYVLSNSKWYDDTLSTGMIYNGPTLRTGSPRCDILVNRTEADILRVRNQFGLEKDAKIIMYAPTFRGGSQSIKRTINVDASSLEYDELINIKDGSSRTLHAGDVKDSYNSEDDSTDYAEDNNADYEDNSYSADENDLSDKNYDADAEDILNNSGISDTEDTSSENVSEEIELEEIELEDKKR